MGSGGPPDKPTLPRTYFVQALASLFRGFESKQDSIQSYKEGLQAGQKADPASYKQSTIGVQREPSLLAQRHWEVFMEEATLR